MSQEERACTICGQVLPLTREHFAQNTRAKKPSSRFAYECKPCKVLVVGIDYRTRKLEAPLETSSVEPLEVTERRAILHAVAVCGGQVQKAAELLGVGKATVYRRLESWEGLPPPPPPPIQPRHYHDRQVLEAELREMLEKLKARRKAKHDHHAKRFDRLGAILRRAERMGGLW